MKIKNLCGVSKVPDLMFRISGFFLQLFHVNSVKKIAK